MTALAPAETPQVEQRAGEAPDTAESPLEGFRIGVTSDRRSSDLIEALERRGAEVLHAPALKIAPVQEDMRLIEDTKAIIAARPDLCIATTAYGMRRWCEAADSFGIGEQLLDTLGACRMFVRGPKARGAVRAAGLADVGISSDETTATLVDMLLAEGVRGKTVAVQLHGYTDVRQLERLRMSGATVLTVTPYRWVKPDGEDKLPRLIEAVCSGNLDVLTFTSAPAVDALWSTAHEMGVYKQLIDALKTSVTTAVVGPVTAHPAGVRTPRPEPRPAAGHPVRQHRAARPQPPDRRPGRGTGARSPAAPARPARCGRRRPVPRIAVRPAGTARVRPCTGYDREPAPLVTAGRTAGGDGRKARLPDPRLAVLHPSCAAAGKCVRCARG